MTFKMPETHIAALIWLGADEYANLPARVTYATLWQHKKGMTVGVEIQQLYPKEAKHHLYVIFDEDGIAEAFLHENASATATRERKRDGRR